MRVSSYLCDPFNNFPVAWHPSAHPDVTISGPPRAASTTGKDDCYVRSRPPELAARGPAKTTGRFAPQENVMDYFVARLSLFLIVIIGSWAFGNIHRQVTVAEEYACAKG